MITHQHTTILGPATESQLGHRIEDQVSKWAHAAASADYRIVQTIIALEGEDPAALVATITVRFQSAREQEVTS